MQATIARQNPVGSEAKHSHDCASPCRGGGACGGGGGGHDRSAAPRTARDAADSDRMVEALRHSRIYQDYERAFGETTGLPVSLRSVEAWNLPHHGKKHENPFCALMASKSRSCSACLQVQQKLTENGGGEPCTLICPAGLSDSVVPVHLGDKLIAYLQTGQIFRRAPSEAQFEKTAKLVAEWGVQVNRADLRNAYFNTRVLPQKEYDAALKLLAIFAQHLSMLTNQLVVQTENQEPPVITKAKQFIQDNQAEDLSLGQVAKAVNTSTFYFCKMFKKATGLNFTEYVSRVRVEKAKNLLLNPNLRVSEIAYEVGFQSLTHFNRVFKKIVGRSPTLYRDNLPTI